MLLLLLRKLLFKPLPLPPWPLLPPLLPQLLLLLRGLTVILTIEKVHGLRRRQDGLQAVGVEVVHDGWKLAHGVVQEGEGVLQGGWKSYSSRLRIRDSHRNTKERTTKH